MTRSGRGCAVSSTVRWLQLLVALIPIKGQAAPPTITGQPRPITVVAGQPAYFIVTDATTCGLILPHWQYNGVNIEDGPTYTGSHTGILHVTSATAAQAGSYRVIISCANGGGATVSNTASLTVSPDGTPTGSAPFISRLGWSGCGAEGCAIWWDGQNGKPINATRLTLTPWGGTPVDVTGLTHRLVRPASSTIFTLTASNAAGTFAQNVAVLVGTVTSVSDCRDISSPGNYVVVNSLSTTSTTVPCLNVHDTNNVFIRSVPGAVISAPGGPETGPRGGAMTFTNVSNFAVNGCTMQAQTPGACFTLVNASGGALSGNTVGRQGTGLGESVQLHSSDYITLAFNTIADEVAAKSCSGIAITNNTIVNRTPFERAQNVYLWHSSGNQVCNNSIDGGRGATRPGVDDGIFLEDESGDLIAVNGIKNCADAGIEAGYAPIRNETISENIIQNSNFGISAWYGLSLAGCTISRNWIGAMPSRGVGFSFHYVPFLTQSTAFFQDNVFSHNTVVNAIGARPSEFLNTGYVLGASHWTIRNNVFIGNDFGAGVTAPIFFFPYMPGVATDGGGNMCTHPVPYPPGYPLDCR